MLIDEFSCRRCGEPISFLEKCEVHTLLVDIVKPENQIGSRNKKLDYDLCKRCFDGYCKVVIL
ncbi:MAG: hypothetical protein R3321_07080 [Nitrososphaeraceae archaeon]|nr:hypothetical protein [Nitrososphaeraceae archaeon]